MKRFESERLYLKLLTEDEVTAEYVSWHQQEHTKYYSSSGRVFSKEMLLEEMATGRASDSLYVYGLYSKENDELFGNIKVGPIVRKHGLSDLVVFIGKHEFLGKGLSVEAIAVGNRVAFEEHDVLKLYGGMFRGNIGSVKAYTRAGWVIEGVLKGQYLVDGKAEDRILVACFNPKYFDIDKSLFPTIDDVY